MSEPLSVAVVGFGVMGRHHANVYAALPGVDLVAVVEPDAIRRSAAAELYGCATFADLEGLLAAGRMDAASVASPTSTHHALTSRLLSSGIHVLVEKPVATQVSEARGLAALSRRHGVVMQVGHITRFYKAVQQLRREVRRPYLIEARRLTPTARIRDVGVILDLMIHDIDIVLGLVDSPVADVSVAGHALNGTPFEDVAAAQITFANGCIARFLASRVAPDAERSLVVAEAERTYRLDFGPPRDLRGQPAAQGTRALPGADPALGGADRYARGRPALADPRDRSDPAAAASCPTAAGGPRGLSHVARGALAGVR